MGLVEVISYARMVYKGMEVAKMKDKLKVTKEDLQMLANSLERNIKLLQDGRIAGVIWSLTLLKVNILENLEKGRI